MVCRAAPSLRTAMRMTLCIVTKWRRCHLLASAMTLWTRSPYNIVLQYRPWGTVLECSVTLNFMNETGQADNIT